GTLQQLTRDHTLVQDLIDRGHIRKEQAATHHFRHVLTQAIGGGAGRAEAEVHRVTLADSDQVLLCSDGLTGMVDDQTIARCLQTSASSAEACGALVEQALKNGGRDNVTVALARYRCAPAVAEPFGSAEADAAAKRR